MHRGHFYRQILPRNMAPDFPGFQGYPLDFEAYMAFQYAGVDVSISKLPGDVEPIVDRSKNSVEYRFDGSAAGTRFGVRYNISTKNHEPGVFITVGVVSNFGDVAALETRGDLRDIADGVSGLVRIDQPFDVEVYQGLINKIYLVWVQGLLRKQLPKP
jgi:hypothetical protein